MTSNALPVYTIKHAPDTATIAVTASGGLPRKDASGQASRGQARASGQARQPSAETRGTSGENAIQPAVAPPTGVALAAGSTQSAGAPSESGIGHAVVATVGS
jgi:hypothetical protein